MRWGLPEPSGRSTFLLLPLAWLAVVVVVAGLTWQVIDSAGRNVLASDDSTLSASGTTSDAENASPGAGRTPRTGNDGQRSESPQPSDSAAPTGPAEPDPSASSSAGSPSGPVPSASSPGAPHSQQPQLRSWQGSAGTVTASCTGSSISLQSASPYDGWAVQVDDRGPGRVRVEFTSGGDDERETRVEAECSGGAPRFEVESND